MSSGIVISQNNPDINSFILLIYKGITHMAYLRYYTYYIICDAEEPPPMTLT